jgi:hypothetical protein
MANKAEVSLHTAKSNIPGMLVNMHFNFTVVFYMALTMLTGILNK